MKILFLGYEPYLTEIIFNLKDSHFLREHKINIMIAKSGRNKTTSRPILKSIKFYVNRIAKLGYKKSIIQKYITIIIRKDRYIYAKEYNKLSKILFPKQNLKFLNGFRNIDILPYNGLYNIENIEQYDLVIVASFGEKIPKCIFNRPRYGTLNIHPSYLPNLRGGYPTYIQAYDKNAIRGTTIHKMSDGWDNGDIVIQKKYLIGENSTNYELSNISARYASEMLEELHNNNFTFKPVKQEEKYVTYCNKILKPKMSVYSISKVDDLQGYIRANAAQHLFPFTSSMYKSNCLSIIEVEKIDHANSKKVRNIFIYKKNDIFYLKHYNSLYLITKYIYRGELGIEK